jgi:A/G-specific adenine glycosylase
MTIHKTFSKTDLQSFKDRVYDYYNTNKRLFVWRNTDNPYYVVVSEIMLQQTQTHRVVEKFDQWISEFPTLESLAKAPQDKVIATWQGLGYNRRALALKQLAERIVQEYKGKIPNDPDILVTFKGIGPYTAASICTFAFNRATVFIETNIRAVYIHEFFPEEKEVHDKQLMPLIERTLDKTEPREWYYALMDYGVMLKKTLKNPSRKSAHHTRQSKFEGSDRQVRGAILKLLISDRSLSEQDFIQSIARDESKIKQILLSLEQEGFIRYNKGYYYLRT